MLVDDLSGSKKAVVCRSCLLNVSQHWCNSCSLCWSWRAPLGIPHNISPQRGRRIHCFEHSRWSPQLQHACSVSGIFLFFSFTVLPLSLSPISKVEPRGGAVTHVGWKCGSCRLCRTKVLISVSSSAPLKEFNTNGCDWTSTVKDTWTSVVYCIYELLLPFLWTVGSVSVLMTPMFTWTTKYQGLEQDYLNMMPLKHAIAFIYDHFILNFCLM